MSDFFRSCAIFSHHAIRLCVTHLKQAFALVAATLLLAMPAAALGQAPYELQDFLNRQWSNEWVTFAASEADITAAKAGQALVDKDGNPALYQLVQGEDGKTRIGLLANLHPLSKQTYRFDTTAKTPTSDIRLEQLDEHTIRLANTHTGIVLTTKLQGDHGPIKAIRLASGQWMGGSKMVDVPSVVSSELRIIAQGPAMVRVQVTLNFEGDRSWTIEARMQANEPVVHLRESFNLGENSHWVLDLHTGFEPEHLYHRRGMRPNNMIGALDTWPVAKQDDSILFHWEPWLHWWQQLRQGTWFGLYNDSSSDMLALAAGEADKWVDPVNVKSGRGWNQTKVEVTQTDDGPQAKFSFEPGQRVWIIASLDKNASLQPMGDKPGEVKATPLPQQYQIKHVEFPLELVNRYVLTWSDSGLRYPRLYLSEAQISDLRKQPYELDRKESQLMRSLEKADATIPAHRMGMAIELFLRTDHEKLGRAIARQTLHTLQNAIDIFVKQETQFTLGFAPHHRRAVVNGINMADLVLGTDYLTAQEKQRIKAQVAFLGYTTVREDYWSPERRFSANPNMTSTVMSFQVTAGSLIPDHPQARQWVEKGLAESDRQLLTWTDEEGGALEAPHYSLATYNYLLANYVMAYHAGFSDKLFHDRMRKLGLMYAHISTPPDPRVKGMRHLPPVGNTYFAEPSGIFATAAYLWREKDPEFSAHMRWMFEQQGSWPQPGVGGSWAPLSPVRSIFNKADLPVKAPTWGSKLFPGQGVVLHAHLPSDRETQLYLISGHLHAHYDYDSGSITFWGKGSPFIDDFGYNGRAPASQHSMFTAKTAGPGGTMTTQAFEVSDLADYTQGQRHAAVRQLMMVKDEDPLGMNYLVMRDSLEADKAADADWRIWLDVESVTPDKQGAHAKGHWDVDLDIHMLAPAQPQFTTEELEVQVWGVKPDGRYGRNTPSRIGLITPVPQGHDAAAVLFPRLKDEAAPIVTSQEDGRVVKIQFKNAVDYVFLSQQTFEHEIDGVTFSGTAGIVRIRNGKATLSLLAPGRIAHGNQTLEKPQATTEPTH